MPSPVNMIKGNSVKLFRLDKNISLCRAKINLWDLLYNAMRALPILKTSSAHFPHLDF